MDTVWRILLFGGLRVEQGNTVVTRFRTQKSALLLAYLVLSCHVDTRRHRGHLRDELVDLLWPDSDPEAGRASLRYALTLLRRVLEPAGVPGSHAKRGPDSVILADRASVQVNPTAFTSDVAEFEAALQTAARAGSSAERVQWLTRAVDLYQGELLAGYHDAWVLREREWFAERYFQALSSLIDGLAETDDLSRALAYARRGLSLDRLREETHVALMRLHVTAGQPAAALRQYRELEGLLRQELESTPSAATRALAREIERGAASPLASRGSRLRASSPSRGLLPGDAAHGVTPQECAPSEPLASRTDGGTAALGENRLVTLLAVRIRDRAPQPGPSPTGEEAVSWPHDPRGAAERRLFQAMEDAILAAAGRVERAQGEELRAAFGLFQAHEDDAERALRAGLTIREAAQKLGLEIVAGIQTGAVTIGAETSPLPDGSPVTQEASRLQQEAGPGQILVGPATYHLTRRAFAFSPVARTRDDPARSPTAYAVEGALPQPEKPYGLEDRFAPLIGREEELSKLQRALAETLDGKGQIVCLIGEAGVGKSRLVAELKGSALPTPLWLEGRCLELGRTARFWPFLDILRQYLGWRPEDGSPARARHLVDTLQSFVDRGELPPDRVEEIGPLLGNLLSLRFESAWDDTLKHAGPQQIRHQSLLALQEFLVALARLAPLALVLEDLHWADPHSLDLISLLMETVAQVPLLLVCVYRPERQHGCWRLGTIAAQKCAGRFTELSLRELTPDQSRRLVAALLNAEDLPATVTDRVRSKAGGNPLFVEEVVRSLLAAELLCREGSDWRTKEESEAAPMPPTVQSIVQSRVDRLGGDLKEVLQQAAVIGRSFRPGLLAEVTREPGELPWALRELEEEQLVYQERVVPVEEYAFHHVLTQEAVYASIPGPRRAALHEQVGKALERLSSGELEAHYEELAHHYERSEADEKAIEYLLKVGEKARRAYLNEAAIGYFQRALERLDGAIPGECWKDWPLAALKGLGQIYHGMGKEPEAEECFRRAIVAGQEIGLDPPELVRLYSWLADVLWWQNRYHEMVQVGEEGLALLGEDSESIEAALMNDAVGWGCFFTNAPERGREFIYRNARFLHRSPYSEELRVVYNHIIDEYTVNKNAEEALKWLQTLEQKAKAHYDLRALGEVHVFTARLLASQGDLLGALLRYQQTLELSTRIGDVKLENWGLGGIGGHYLSLGKLRDAREYANRRREITESIGERQFIRTSYVLLGMISLCEGAWDQAADAFLKAAQLDREIGSRPWEEEETLALGRSYLAKGEREEALKRFQQSLSLGGPSPQILSALEEAYPEPEEFHAFCHSLWDEHPEVWDSPFVQWYLEPTGPRCVSHLLISERFVMSLSSDWVWQDPFGDCTWRAENGLELHAANGRDLRYLNLSAPRFLRPASEGLALETTCVAVSAEKPAIGGLLLWKDSRNYLRLDRGTRGPYEISFAGCVADRDIFIGRGRLPAERVILRLERVGHRVNALCSADGQAWLTVGQVAFAVEDPLKVGVHGIGQIDRTIYHGAYPCGTAIRFESFRLLR